MALTFEGEVRTEFFGRYTSTAGSPETLTVAAQILGENWVREYRNTGTQQANHLFARKYTVASAITTLDLVGGSLTDWFGNTLAFFEVKEIGIKNYSTTSGQQLQISGNLTQLWFPSQVGVVEIVDPNGLYHKASPIDGFETVPGAQDTISINTVTNTVTFGVVIIGRALSL